jgi:hypothetical protein
MGRSRRWSALLGAIVCCATSVAVLAGPYDTAAQRAATWLTANMASTDGSWGGTDDVKYLDTSEVALALRAYNMLSPGYYAALTWLQNHLPANADYRARRILALAANGNDVSTDLQYLASVEHSQASGQSGFGLSLGYFGSPLDTALTLQAYSQAAKSEDTTAVAYLKAVQLTGADSGWAVAQESSSDPATTAHVLLALIGYRSADSTLALPITNGLAALNAKVTTSSPSHLEALSALVNLRNSSTSSQASTLLSALVATQSSDGSWGEDPYATALALRAFAAALGRDAGSVQQVVEIDDANLRAAINQTLGRSALDALNQGELAQLTSLDISGRGINDVNGLQYAVNLTLLNAQNNNISSWTPVNGLTQATILKNGNPGQPPVGGAAAAGLSGPLASQMAPTAGTNAHSRGPLVSGLRPTLVTTPPAKFVFSPFKDITIKKSSNTDVNGSSATDPMQSITDVMPANLTTLTWSSAVGECGSESWAGLTYAELVANVQAFVSVGKKYIISTGGPAGVFTCGSDTGFDTFIQRYYSDNLVGIDFDIEGGQGGSVVSDLVARVKSAQGKYPGLRFSFTFRTLGGNVQPSLSALGSSVMAAIQAAGLTNYFINLMAIADGSAEAGYCTLVNGTCDMGQSALQAAELLHSGFGVPYSQIELTPVIGRNTQDETFTLADVVTVASYALQKGLAGVHFWSFDRDFACPPSAVSPTCNTPGQTKPLEFTTAFLSSLGL